MKYDTIDITVNMPNMEEQDYAVVNLTIDEAMEAATEAHPNWTSAVIIVTRQEQHRD